MEGSANGDADFGYMSSVSESGSDERKMDTPEDPGLDAMKARANELEAEIEKLIELQKLKEMQNEVKRFMAAAKPTMPIQRSMSLSNISAGVVDVSDEEKADADARSVYIGNVDYSATAEELESHFIGCGAINRVTILCDRYTGHPKGFAYVEFADKESVSTAAALHDSLFKGRQIKVNAKRTNVPGISSTNRLPRGRGQFRGRGGFATFSSDYTGYDQYASGPYSRPYRGRGASRPRRGYFYSPY